MKDLENKPHGKPCSETVNGADRRRACSPVIVERIFSVDQSMLLIVKNNKKKKKKGVVFYRFVIPQFKIKKNGIALLRHK